ncbi:UvrD-helicase domain-containing protein [Halobacillus halophilus]|uniref:UvrD-helicase domain-containing protein n=1 Tax=Halobacillus halophilus TaxID=1570 RepID=UPI001CD572C5|nr:UvrD-helicase domain-containing protein [Halobacillus halophilus]MCA1011749.1 UvrD-helicase domain-containing protein [Halobacillus halophilus]
MNSTPEVKEKRLSFALKSAKVWQNYFETKGVLPDITLSDEQKAVVQQVDDQLLINGSAGSGKSITLLYKLIKTLEQEEPGKRILYCSFNDTLIVDTYKRLGQSEKYQKLKDKHTLHINTFHYMAAKLLHAIGMNHVPIRSTNQSKIEKIEDNIQRRTMVLVDNFMNSPNHKHLPEAERLYKTHAGNFLKEEIAWIKANGYSKEDYFTKERTGRGSHPRLTKMQRKTIYRLYEDYLEMTKKEFHDYLDYEDYALLLLKHMDEIPDGLKYDHLFIDEVQDLQPMQIMALVKLTKKSIVLSGDSKQKIYQRTPLSYKDLGLKLEGRKNKTLKINFRSTKQIMDFASTIEFLDVENDREDDQKFVREGPKPEIRYYDSENKQSRYLINSIKDIRMGTPEATIAIVHRYDSDVHNINNSSIFLALSREFSVIRTEQYGKSFNYSKKKKPIYFTDPFSIKGLEFDYVFIIHFDREHYPNQKRIKELDQRSGGDTFSDSYLKDEDSILNDEKKILYVAITRAKKKVVLLGSGIKSPFLRQFHPKNYEAHNFKKMRFR